MVIPKNTKASWHKIKIDKKKTKLKVFDDKVRIVYEVPV